MLSKPDQHTSNTKNYTCDAPVTILKGDMITLNASYNLPDMLHLIQTWAQITG